MKLEDMQKILSAGGKFEILEGSIASCAIDGKAVWADIKGGGRGGTKEVFRKVCENHAFSLILNMGRAMLQLPDKHATAPTAADEKKIVDAKNFACARAILAALGTSVQLANRVITCNGNLLSEGQQYLTLRVGENFYFQSIDKEIEIVADRPNQALLALIKAAVKPLALHIVARGESEAKKAEVERKKAARKAQQASYRAAKKRRAQELASAAKEEEEATESEEEEVRGASAYDIIE